MKSNKLKKAAMIGAMATLSVGGMNAANSHDEAEDVKVDVEVLDGLQHTVGVLTGMEQVASKKNKNSVVLAYHLDTDGDALPDVIKYRTLPKDEKVLHFPLGARIDVGELRDANNNVVYMTVNSVKEVKNIARDKTR